MIFLFQTGEFPEKLSPFKSIMALAIEMGWIQWFAVVFSVIYVILAVKENVWCWFFGLIGVALSFKVYVDVQLYSDAILQIYYGAMSIYGWWHWTQHKKKQDSEMSISQQELLDARKLPVSTWSMQDHLTAIGIGVILSFLLGYMWTYFGAALPYIDAFTTSFSVIATIMVARKVLENWIYWIIIDFVCIFVYLHREIYLFSILFFVYLIIAIIGHFSWKKQYLVEIGNK